MAKMIRWEYRKTAMQQNHPNIEAMCNGLGDEGWELVSTVAYGDNIIYLFKRDKHWQDKEDCGQDE